MNHLDANYHSLARDGSTLSARVPHETATNPRFERAGSVITKDLQGQSREPQQELNSFPNNTELAPAANYTNGTTKEAGDVSHQIISSHFIGPRAENLDFFKENINNILEELHLARLNYYPEDGVREVRNLLHWP
jgi:hypothetical protein